MEITENFNSLFTQINYAINEDSYEDCQSESFDPMIMAMNVADLMSTRCWYGNCAEDLWEATHRAFYEKMSRKVKNIPAAYLIAPIVGTGSGIIYYAAYVSSAVEHFFKGTICGALGYLHPMEWALSGKLQQAHDAQQKYVASMGGMKAGPSYMNPLVGCGGDLDQMEDYRAAQTCKGKLSQELLVGKYVDKVLQAKKDMRKHYVAGIKNALKAIPYSMMHGIKATFEIWKNPGILLHYDEDDVELVVETYNDYSIFGDDTLVPANEDC